MFKMKGKWGLPGLRAEVVARKPRCLPASLSCLFLLLKGFKV